MDNVTMIKAVVYGGLAAVGAVIIELLGGWDTALKWLLIIMGADYISGFLVAAVFKRSSKTEHGALESKAGLKGLVKKGTMLTFVLVANGLDIVSGLGYVRDGVIVALIVNEVVSLTENAGLMGVPLPQPIRQAVEVLKVMADKKPTGKGKSDE